MHKTSKQFDDAYTYYPLYKYATVARDIEDDFMIFYEQDNKMCLYARDIGWRRGSKCS